VKWTLRKREARSSGSMGVNRSMEGYCGSGRNLWVMVNGL
jgi:hypothetical protein